MYINTYMYYKEIRGIERGETKIRGCFGVTVVGGREVERGNGNMVVTLISERGDLMVHNYTVCVCVLSEFWCVCECY